MLEIFVAIALAATVAARGGSWQEELRRWADQELALGHERILDTAVPQFERIMIQAALDHTKGRRRDAAQWLGWGRNTLTRKIKELEMGDETEEEIND